VVKSRKNDEAARLLEDGITTVAMNVFVVGGDLSPTFHPRRARKPSPPAQAHQAGWFCAFWKYGCRG